MRKLTLKEGWELRQIDLSGSPSDFPFPGGAVTYPVKSMPMQVADVLLEQGVIDDPWKPGLTGQYAWIGESDWAYTASFALPKDFSPPYRLNCEGLDLFAEVCLNGRKAASHENALYPLAAELPDDILRPGEENTMAVVFHSTAKEIQRRTPELEGSSLFDRANALNLRKNRTDFTGYLGQKPYFVRMGVFGDISLISEGGDMFEWHETDALVNGAMDEGFLSIRCGIRHSLALEVETEVFDPEGQPVFMQKCPVSPGQTVLKQDVTLQNPRLWYPAGYGEHPVYRVEVRLLDGSAVLDSFEVLTGFRRLEMPRPMHFRINGIDVPLYGGNWAPQSAITECWDQAKAERLMDLAVRGNFNALRVWSCGSVVPDSFYDYADRIGLLIWQDFYIPYTGPSEEGRENNLKEANRLIGRLKHHPGLILWCGGNESLSFYYWTHNRASMPGREVLEVELRRLCENRDPSRVYLPESPYGGYDHNDPRVWDTHCYTNYSYVPGYDYLNFASEDFRISSPQINSLRKFMPEQDIWPDGYRQVHTPRSICEVPDSWLDYSSGPESELKYGPLWEFYDATDGESMVHRVNMAASVFYRTSIERLRRGRRSGDNSGNRCCGGYLVWKLNDSWPQIYGAKIDYFMEPTMPFYFIRRAYEPLQISFDIGEYLHVWVVNDSRENVSATLHVSLFHMTQNSLTAEFTMPVSIPAGSSVDVADLTEEFQTFRRQNVLFAQLTDPFGRVIARTTQAVGVERYLRFPTATLQVTCADGEISVTTDRYAHCVYLEGNDEGDCFGWEFDDNYFSLMPGEVKKVRVLGPHQKGTVSAKEFYSGIVSSAEYSRK